ncbi:MAG: DnaJ domain-containing protein, partial [Gammaproteobacteria bacterium]|nr:DnaJ domain-containing protein [Gammaproteobacteria bacterium]NIR99364.1 DnaJ domain-containing protein [Gammaproteobacteria bacterium]NIT64860.1 DnaJ domain-containing protein [Gammaproteobacteria bacterium]NIV21814.1 DnaJ domain-containing protein [Gammaproteobacteria bacterium]NIY33440.1 DnaJ domain-containing protein [Gammaproteobacteria bacterium]
MADYYNLLGVAPDASPDALRRAYRARAKAVHPDAHPHDDPARRTARKREFVALARAYETLRDPARRASYDRRLAGAGGSGAAGGS